MDTAHPGTSSDESHVPPPPEYKWDNAANDYVLVSSDLPPDIQEALDRVEDDRVLSPEEFEEIINSEEVAEGLANISEFFSELFTLKKAKIDGADKRYRKAVDVAYNRAVRDPRSRFLKLFRNRDIIDIGFIAAFLLPYLGGIFQEIRAKKKAAPVARGKAAAPSQATVSETTSDENEGGIGDE